MEKCFRCSADINRKDRVRCRYCDKQFHYYCVPFTFEERWKCENCGEYNYRSKKSPYTLIVHLKTIYRKAIEPFIKKKKEAETK